MLDSQVAAGRWHDAARDTYDIRQGVINAVEARAAAASWAVRSTGDLVAQAFKVRGQLDAMGATSTKITVTSDWTSTRSPPSEFLVDSYAWAPSW